MLANINTLIYMAKDIKEILEQYMDANGITRAEVMERTGRQAQAWSSLAKDAKWGALCEIMSAIGFDLEQIVSDTLYGKAHTTGFVECPNCHKAIKLKAEEG